MVLAPLMAFKPSKTVKRQMQFREKALALGLQIKVADLPQSHRARVRQQDLEQGVVYRLPFRQKQSLAGIQHQICIATEKGFEWPSGQQKHVKELFEQCWPGLPADAVALELSATGLGLYWSEQGSPGEVQRAYDLLNALYSKLLDYYGVSDAGA